MANYTKPKVHVPPVRRTRSISLGMVAIGYGTGVQRAVLSAQGTGNARIGDVDEVPLKEDVGAPGNISSLG